VTVSGWDSPVQFEFRDNQVLRESSLLHKNSGPPFRNRRRPPTQFDGSQPDQRVRRRSFQGPPSA
jgi:hypothetical protein